MRRLTAWQQLLCQGALALLALFVVIPFWGMLRLAFDGSLKGAPTEFRWLPAEPTLEVFRQVWRTPSQALPLTGLLRNTLLTAGSASLLAVVSGMTAAYAFARFRFAGRRPGLLALLVGAFLPSMALTTPLYILLSAMRLRTSLAGLTIIYTAFAMPFCVWNMRAAFQAVASELEDAAFLDGATPVQAFWFVTLPLALPSLAVAALVAFLAGYSEFAIGWLFVESGSNVTLAMALWGIRQMGGTPWSQLAALAVLMCVPVLLLFLLLQRYLIRGLGAGVLDD